MKKCRCCGMVIKDWMPYFMCHKEDVKNVCYKEDDSDNVYCSKECFCEDLMLAEVFE